MVWTGVPGTPWYSNFYFNNGVGSPTTMRNDVGNMLTSLAQLVTTPIVMTVDPEVPLIDSANGEILGVDIVPDLSVDALDTGEAVPYAVQGLCRLRTDAFIGGRRLQGRFNVPGLNLGFIQDGIMDPSAQDGLEAAVSPLAATAASEWIIWSKKTGAIAPVANVSVWNQFAMLTSRRD